MAKRIAPEDMIELRTEEAEKLVDETRYGLGTPIEARIANAIRENAANIGAQNKGMNRYIQKMSETQRSIEGAVGDIRRGALDMEKLCDKAREISDYLETEMYDAKVMSLDVSEYVAQAIGDLVGKTVEASVEKANFQTADWLDRAEAKLDKAVEKMDEAKEGIGEAVRNARSEAKDLSSKIERTMDAAKMNTFGPIMRFALIVVLVLSLTTSVASCATLAPVIDGRAAITHIG